MADESRPVRVALHPNRGVPAVLDFGLRPGRVTLARLSQSGASIRLVVGTASVVDREHPFIGTSAVLVPDRPVADVLRTIFAEGLEHHLVVAHGDWRRDLEAVAKALGIPVVELT
jgi:L-arabinose isomerase